MKELELVSLEKEYKMQIAEYVQELNNNKNIIGNANLFDTKELDLLREKDEETEVPSTIYLTIRKSDNRIVGHIQINHYLNENLLHCGGHIVSIIRPSEIEKCYLAEQIRLGLKKCKELGIGRVLINTNKNNNTKIKAIIDNGGIFENEINMPNGEINQRYWITLKKRYANRHKSNKPNTDLIYLVKEVREKYFNGDICYYNFKNANIKICTPEGKIIIDNNYKLLGFYDYNSKIKLSAFYDKNDEIIEWYFDIATKLGKENDVPYEDDLYLDILVKPTGEIILLDEDELNQALSRFEITRSEYEMAYKEANKLIVLLKSNIEKLKNFTDKHLKNFEK